MLKKEIVAKVAEELNVNKSMVGEIVDSFFDKMAGGLNEGDKIYISRFGTFNLKHRKSRLARNFVLGEHVYTEPYKTVTFKCSQLLKDKLNEKAD